MYGIFFVNLGVGRQLSDDGPCICAEIGQSTKRSRDFDGIEEDGVSCMN
jgi:hypothetical protein